MKRCPECLAAYDNSEKFCETDGTALTVDPFSTVSMPVNPQPVEVKAGNSNSWLGIAVGLLCGVLISIGVYFSFLAPRPGDDSDPRDSNATSGTERSAPLLTDSRSAPRVESNSSTEDGEETDPEPSPTGSPETKETETKPATHATNTGPISTGTREQAGVLESVIEFTDGSAIRVEAAWEDNNGVWYRRAGLVSFVDRNRVKSITETKESRANETP